PCIRQRSSLARKIRNNLLLPFHPVHTQRLQQQVDQLTSLVTQLPERRAGQVEIPSSPSRASAPVPVAMPEKYDGNPDHCQAFLMQCGLYVEEHPERFVEETAKVRFVISLLTGCARDWATALWMDDSPLLDSARDFQQAFKGIFNHPAVGRSLGERLFDVKQGPRTVAEFALEFQTIAAVFRWPDEVLRILYRRALNPEVQDELTSRGATLSFEEYIGLSVTIDNSVRERRRRRPCLATVPTPPAVAEGPSEPMQLGHAPLSIAERRRRVNEGLCMYCGEAGHVLRTCPIRPSHPGARMKVGLTPYVGSSLVQVPIVVTGCGAKHHACALVDFGAAGNFMDLRLARRLGFPLLVFSNPVSVLGVNGDPLPGGRVTHHTGPVTLQVGVFHVETLDFLILPKARDPVILGHPWLQKHNPQIDWRTGELIAWSSKCFQHCIARPCYASSIESPEPEDFSRIPIEYSAFKDVFSKALSFRLPPHRECDCAIDLLEGAHSPKGHLYPLSVREEEAMETYVQEALNQGIIRPSTSPITAGFFFVKKKDGGLRPCVDYRALNTITVKRQSQLPGSVLTVSCFPCSSCLLCSALLFHLPCLLLIPPRPARSRPTCPSALTIQPRFLRHFPVPSLRVGLTLPVIDICLFYDYPFGFSLWL
uniref:CCHC-type domain-containing protein n=1 Tax=Paramormyrops kingsleyae TaxID=1676925 RepID=A0A3B3SA72_9TELE